MNSPRVDALARQIWSYCDLRTPLVRSDAIIVLCSHDIRIASYASRMFLEGWAPLIIFSGGLSAFTAGIYPTSEAQAFRDVALALGVPAEAVLMEDKSTNTQENLEFSWKLFEQRNMKPSKVILIQKPNMLRRVFATATHLFPDVEFGISSHEISFSEAPHEHLSKEMLIHELVGDMQRISLYAERGFIAPQAIEPAAWNAFLALKELGYTGNLAR